MTIYLAKVNSFANPLYEAAKKEDEPFLQHLSPYGYSSFPAFRLEEMKLIAAAHGWNLAVIGEPK